MAEATDLHEPWLVAVWPGMGSVAWLAGGYLVQQLRARRVAELDARDFFELQAIEVRHGIMAPTRLPHNLFVEWRDPQHRHDLLIFVGEAQPATGGYQLCQALTDYAVRRGVKRLFTFAAMATQLTPGSSPPRVFAAATDEPALQQVRKLNVEVLENGQISGLNGLLLAAGAERGLSGTCLLGELPYFAVAVPNPRASLVVLERFAELAGIDIDFTELELQAKAIDRQLEQLVEQMQQSAAGGPGDEEDTDADEQPNGAPGAAPEEGTDAAAPKPPPRLDPKAQRRVESLFERARQDHSKAFELKQELDRLGVFKQYEDRFLDLFRRAQ